MLLCEWFLLFFSAGVRGGRRTDEEEVFMRGAAGLGISFDDNNVVNITGRNVPMYVRFVASLGPKFNFVHTEDGDGMEGREEWRQTWENRMDHLYEVTRDVGQLMAVKAIKKGIKSMRLDTATTAGKFIREQERKASIFLRRNRDMVIAQADKGGKQVLMTREVYMSKLQGHIDEGIAGGIYKKVEDASYEEVRDAMEERGRRMKSRMKQHVEQDVKCGLHSEMVCMDEEPFIISEIRAAIKVHKEGMPPRPIVAASSRWCKGISRWALGILKEIAGANDGVKVKNSEEFVRKVGEMGRCIGKEYEMSTWDYESMYTNIPRIEAYKTIAEYSSVVERMTSAPVDEFIGVIEFLVESSAFFWHKGEMHEQISGITMGNDLSQALADIVTNKAAINTRRSFDRIQMPLMAKYIDDFAVVMRKDAMNDFKETIEREVKGLPIKKDEAAKDGSITYLDVMVMRDEEGQLTTRWWQKECSSRRILDFHSNHPVRVKVNMVREYIRHALQVTSPLQYKRTTKDLRAVFRRSSYPKNFVAKNMNEALDKYGGIHVTSECGVADTEVCCESEVRCREGEASGTMGRKRRRENSSNGSENRRTKRPATYMSMPFYDESSLRAAKEIAGRVCSRMTLAPKMMDGNRRNFASMNQKGPVRAKKNCIFGVRCESCNFCVTEMTGRMDIARAMETMMKRKSVLDHMDGNDGHVMASEPVNVRVFGSMAEMMSQWKIGRRNGIL